MSEPAEPTSLQDGGSRGSAEGGPAVTMLHKHLICPICHEVFNKPVVILPCQHNLCRKCANQLYQPSLFQARTTMTVNSGHFRCPSCRQEVVLDRHGVYGLQRNLLVESIIDIYNQEISNNISCVPSPVSPDQPLRCSIHKTERVNIYCLTCGLLTCSLCKVFGAHQSCQVAPLSHICQQKKDELHDHVASLTELNHKIQSVIKQLEDTCASVTESSDLQKQRVCDKFQQVFSILEERQQVMTQQLKSEQEEKTSRIQALMCCYENHVEANRKLLEQASHSVKEEDLVTFIQSSRELIAKVTEASHRLPPESLEPAAERLTEYRYNFSRQERALRSISFHKEQVPQEQQQTFSEEPCIHNILPKHHQDSALEPTPEVIFPNTQDLDSAGEAAAVISPPEGPPTLDQEAVPLDIPVETPRKVLAFSEGEPDQHKHEEMLGNPSSDPVKEGNACEHQEGMTTQQVITLIFYLFTLLLVLKRVWFYISCFICT
ncbi:tripartite motif-containing protein 54-like isoform X2 [Takifugu rubripes]|nr:tripartite motif-containing protein 54-like isoform X2 [Takifugu rubripes]